MQHIVEFGSAERAPASRVGEIAAWAGVVLALLISLVIVAGPSEAQTASFADLTVQKVVVGGTAVPADFTMNVGYDAVFGAVETPGPTYYSCPAGFTSEGSGSSLACYRATAAYAGCPMRNNQCVEFAPNNVTTLVSTWTCPAGTTMVAYNLCSDPVTDDLSSGEWRTIVAGTDVTLGASSGPAGYVDGDWECEVSHASGAVSSGPLTGPLILSQYDSAVCTLTSFYGCGGLPVSIVAVPGVKTIGSPGNDVIVGTSGRDIIHGGGGNDVICSVGGNDVILGGAGADTIYGGDGGDVILGGTGADQIFGEAGRDRLFGGDGNDVMDGGADTDAVRGELGNDTLRTGPSGNDRLVGGDGNDVLDGRPTTGSTRMIGEAGDDTFYGSQQLDRMWGGADDDTMYGRGYNDLLRGGTGNDIMYGESGRDTLDGGAGDDFLHGGSGNSDKMVGMAGTDTCDGGSGIADFAHSTCENPLGVP